MCTVCTVSVDDSVGLVPTPSLPPPLLPQADDGWFSSKCRKVNHSQSSLSFLVPSFLSFSEEGNYATYCRRSSQELSALIIYMDALYIPTYYLRIDLRLTKCISGKIRQWSYSNTPRNICKPIPPPLYSFLCTLFLLPQIR